MRRGSKRRLKPLNFSDCPLLLSFLVKCEGGSIKVEKWFSYHSNRIQAFPILFRWMYVQGVLSELRLGFVDSDFKCSIVCPTLLGLMGIWQTRLGSWERWWKTEIKVSPTQVSAQLGHPVCLFMSSWSGPDPPNFATLVGPPVHFTNTVPGGAWQPNQILQSLILANSLQLWRPQLQATLKDSVGREILDRGEKGKEGRKALSVGTCGRERVQKRVQTLWTCGDIGDEYALLWQIWINWP